MLTFLVSDLHGNQDKYAKLTEQVELLKPRLVFIAGDLSNHFKKLSDNSINNFYEDYLFPHLQNLKTELGADYPKVFLIMGNDDPRIEESHLIKGEKRRVHFLRLFKLSTFTISIKRLGKI